MIKKLSRGLFFCVLSFVLVLTTHHAVFAQDDYWPYLPSDKEIDDAVASFIQKETFEREVLKCNQIEDYIEKQICLSKRSLYFQMSDEYVYKTEIPEVDFIKMHHSLQPDPLIGSEVVLSYTEKNYVLHKTKGDIVEFEYKTALLQYENGWFFDPAVVLPWDENHLDSSLPPKEKRDARVNLLFRDFDSRGYYGYLRGFAGEQITEENSPPQVSLIYAHDYSPWIFFPGDTIELEAVTDDPDGDPLTFSWFINGERMGVAPNFNLVRISDLEVGDYVVEVHVSDDKGNSAKSEIAFEVVPLVYFSNLQTEKPIYVFNNTVKLIYAVENQGDEAVDYYVEYKILDPSNNEIFFQKGANHHIEPGEIQEYQSNKYVVPDNALEGTYEIQAKIISERGNYEERTSYLISTDIFDVSYILGYEMPLSEEEPVPLRMIFKVKDELKFDCRITEVEILEQNPEIFFVDSLSGDPKPIGFREFREPVKEAIYNFKRLQAKYLLTPRTSQQNVEFWAKIDFTVRKGENEYKYELTDSYTVPIKASFSVCVMDQHQRADGTILTPTLNNNPLPLDKQCKQPFLGLDGDTLRIFVNTRVLIRDLSGTVFSLGDYGSDVLSWEVKLSQMSSQQLEQYTTSDSGINIEVVKQVAEDLGSDKGLDFLFQKFGAKAVSGPFGIILQIFDANKIGGIHKIAVRLRSILGLSISPNGVITVKNYEGEPEVVLPDGSALLLPSGYQTTMDTVGNFSEPQPFDTSPILGNTQLQPTPALEENDYGMGEETKLPFQWIVIPTALVLAIVIFFILSKKLKSASARSADRPAKQFSDGIVKTAKQPRASKKKPVTTKPAVKGASPQQAQIQKNKSSKRFCKKCGQPIREGAAFCRNCGQKIE